MKAKLPFRPHQPIPINLSKDHSMFPLRNPTELLGRLLLVSLFLVSGIGKITAYSGTAGYMASVGVPGALLPLVIAAEALSLQVPRLTPDAVTKP